MERTALIVIDMINAYEHADADLLIPSVRSVIPHIVKLLRAPGATVSP